MAEVLLARQPIFDRNLEVAGYELLFRGGNLEKALVSDHDAATATVILNAFTELGLDRVAGRHTAWLNVNRDFLVKELAYALPPTLVGLELLEDQLIDGHLVGGLKELKRRGYRIALDDFRYTSRSEHLLKVADRVKLDIMALGRERFRHEVAMVKRYGAKVVAEKIETREEHAFCAKLGCDFFQGYFFCKPELMRDRGIAPNRLALLQLLAALQDPKVDFRELERLIGRDVALSYRLLRYINSAFFGLRRKVLSIGAALALLGLQNVKRWATLSVFAGIDDKPRELTVAALVRARFCEGASSLLPGSNPAQLFTLGLFSVVDALMDVPIEQALSSIPFPDVMRRALVAREGRKGRLLNAVTALERGDFTAADELVEGASGIYTDALGWATDASETLFEPHAAPFVTA